MYELVAADAPTITDYAAIAGMYYVMASDVPAIMDALTVSRAYAITATDNASVYDDATTIVNGDDDTKTPQPQKPTTPVRPDTSAASGDGGRGNTNVPVGLNRGGGGHTSINIFEAFWNVCDGNDDFYVIVAPDEKFVYVTVSQVTTGLVHAVPADIDVPIGRSVWHADIDASEPTINLVAHLTKGPNRYSDTKNLIIDQCQGYHFFAESSVLGGTMSSMPDVKPIEPQASSEPVASPSLLTLTPQNNTQYTTQPSQLTPQKEKLQTLDKEPVLSFANVTAPSSDTGTLNDENTTPVTTSSYVDYMLIVLVALIVIILYYILSKLRQRFRQNGNQTSSQNKPYTDFTVTTNTCTFDDLGYDPVQLVREALHKNNGTKL